ncbi:hypothetical protein MKK67_07145 [Methylobacterium sp. J-072]|uniref:hypothetical protein n=1 Tax=Methylobacterium sp. J-072 TaxID=2836651 RepID=UPI001FB887BA|nr:hypothetical protein [Methylobacterium sp. J-072]MCJ2092270.1 hypothetical protein [Methylobacterium sp. J-072]
MSEGAGRNVERALLDILAARGRLPTAHARDPSSEAGEFSERSDVQAAPLDDEVAAEQPLVSPAQPMVGQPMAGPTREEIDAKIAAAEARGDTKLKGLEGKIDLLIQTLGEVRNDNRSLKTNIWTVCAIIVAAIVGVAGIIAAVVPFAFQTGIQFKDLTDQAIATRSSGSTSQPSQTPPAKQGQ